MMLSLEQFRMNRNLLLPIVFLLLAVKGVAQEKDFQLWTEASVEKALNKKVSILAVEELRFNKNASRIDEWHNTLGAQYAITKKFKVRAFYRFTQSNTLKKGYADGHRFYTDISYRTKVKRFVLRYRLRYQTDYVTIEDFTFDGQMLRNQFTVKYNIRKTPLMPFASYEAFYNLGSQYGSAFVRHRFTGGFDYDLTDYFSARIFYRYQKTNGYFIDARDTYILGLSASFEF